MSRDQDIDPRPRRKKLNYNRTIRHNENTTDYTYSRSTPTPSGTKCHRRRPACETMRRSGIGKNGTAMGSGEEAVLGEMEACRIGGGDELGSDEVDDAGEGWPTSGNERVKKLMASRCSITLRFCSIVECASRRRRASSRNHMRELLVWSGRQLTVSQEPRGITHSHHDMCVHLTRDLDTGFHPRLSPCRRAERQLARPATHSV